MSAQNSNNRVVEHPAIEVLIRFFTAMNGWEREVIARNFQSVADFNKRGKKHLRRLREIYKQFCRPGAEPERLVDINWGDDIPDYNPQTEKIIALKCSPRKVTIETRMTEKYGFRMQYELIPVGGEWRLRSSRKCFDSDLEKWCYCEL